MGRRFKKLRDWPDCLKKLSVDELRKERDWWKSRLAWLRHREARKETENRIRKVEDELDSRTRT
jgi:hypothetical protein